MRFESRRVPGDPSGFELTAEARRLGMFIPWSYNHHFTAHLYSKLWKSKDFWGLSYYCEVGYMSAVAGRMSVTVLSVSEGRAWLLGLVSAQGLGRELDR